MRLVKVFVLMVSAALGATMTWGQAAPVNVTQPVAMLNERGIIDVFELRKAVSRLERQLPQIDLDRCETQACEAAAAREKQRFEKSRSAFMDGWGVALLTAIGNGDEVAEVIWRQCSTTQVIERSALASTCDSDPVRRKAAALRLRQIGFEAAFDEDAEGTAPVWEPNQDKRRSLSQARTLRQMEAGVYGGWTLDNYHGGNGPYSPEELFDIRRAAVIDSALFLVRRSFTYIDRRISNSAPYAQLRLNRDPLGTPTLAWSANVLHSGTPYTGPYDPAWTNGFEVVLNYDNRRVIRVGGKRDAQYLRMLHDTLTRSEQRIDYWLKRDPRWSVFLLHRQGHHEWVPQGTVSPFGHLNPRWAGEWVLEKEFVNFVPFTDYTPARLKIRVGDTQTIAQFEEAGAEGGYACELRYSGATSLRPEDGNHAKTMTATALGYLPGLARVSQYDPGPVTPFAPMNPHKVYRQVLVQCPQGEWPDNRNKHFLFLARDTLIEVRKEEDSQGTVVMRHWRRGARVAATAKFNPLASAFSLQPTLDRLAQEAAVAEQTDAQQTRLRAQVSSSTDAEALIASLTQLRMEKLFYGLSSDFPENLTRLIGTPGIATKVCTAYRKGLSDALQRFNLMVVLNKRARNGALTPDERSVVPDCLRLALEDPNAWVRVEAVDAFSLFVEPKDRAKLLALQKDPDELVRRYSENALSELKTRNAEK